MKKSYNADRFIGLFEKFYRDFQEAERDLIAISMTYATLRRRLRI